MCLKEGSYISDTCSLNQDNDKKSYMQVSYDTLLSCGRISDVKGSIMCDSARRTLRVPLEEYLHMYCVNLWAG